MMKPATNSTRTASTVRKLMSSCRLIAITTSSSMKTMNHGS